MRKDYRHIRLLVGLGVVVLLLLWKIFSLQVLNPTLKEDANRN